MSHLSKFSIAECVARGKRDGLDQKISRLLLLTLKRVLDWHNMPFWLLYGTALGAYRDGKFIDYDTDLDAGMIYDDFRVLVEMARAGHLANHSLMLLRDWPTIISFEMDGHYVDIYGFKKASANEYLCEDARIGRLAMKAEWLDREPHPIGFCGTLFNLPKHPVDYLEYCYGKDWRTPKRGEHCNK